MSGVTEATKRVAGAIIDHFNKRTGQCDPSIERLATLLGIDRATVMRATDKLHELGLIEKASHGGKAHRARYLPNWDRFRTIVEDWDTRMKTGDAPAKTEAPNVASVRRTRSQGCDVKGRSAATQTLRSNPSNKPVEGEGVENSRKAQPIQSERKGQQGLWRGSKPVGQRSFLMPITGGKNASHAEAAHASAERRWTEAAAALGQPAYAEVIDWMTWDRQEAATQAEMQRKGGGLAFIVGAMQGERMRAHG